MISQRIATWFTPAPDSGVADDIRRGKSPWTDSIHLLWSIWIFITPLFDEGKNGYTWAWLAFTLGSYPIFLLLFAKSQLAPRRRVNFYAIGMAVLCLVLLPWYPSGVSYFVYACVMLLTCKMRFRAYMIQLIAMNVVFIAAAWRFGYPWQLMLSISAMTFTICTTIRVEHANKEKDAALRLSQDEVRRLAATAERERIGRDLHDLLGHTLSLITLKLELSRRLFDRDVDAARREVADAEKVARQALAEVRCAVTGIRATDIAAELAASRLMLETASVHLEYNAVPPLPAEVERALSLVLREAATNICRHAGASTASITFEAAPSGLALRIADNGRGGVRDDGNGLCGMRERVRAIGGTLLLDSPSGRGTTIRIQIPLTSSLLRWKELIDVQSAAAASLADFSGIAPVAGNVVSRDGLTGEGA
jgi:two-component system sensor histidine kinase DesK